MAPRHSRETLSPAEPRRVYSMPILDVNEIRRILPHRYPFLLVDRIVELEAERIVGIKNVTVNEPFFNGHFPEFPVMPGVMIVEAMAQTAGILVPWQSILDRESKTGFRAVSIDGAQIPSALVVPGDQLRIEMVVIRKKGTVAKMAGKATVDGVVVAEAEVMCKLQDKAEPPKKKRGGGETTCRVKLDARSSNSHHRSARRGVHETAGYRSLPHYRPGGRKSAPAPDSWRTSSSKAQLVIGERQRLLTVFDCGCRIAGHEVQRRACVHPHWQPQQYPGVCDYSSRHRGRGTDDRNRRR